MHSYIPLVTLSLFGLDLCRYIIQIRSLPPGTAFLIISHPECISGCKTIRTSYDTAEQRERKAFEIARIPEISWTADESGFGSAQAVCKIDTSSRKGIQRPSRTPS